MSGPSRRHFLKTTGGLVAGSMLAGHGLVPARAARNEASAVQLMFTTPGGSKPYCATFDIIAKDYEKLHPNITFPKTMCGTGQQDFNQWLLARVAAGNPPDATLLWTNPATLGVLGALEPIDDLMRLSTYSKAQDWPASALASCQFNNRTYGLPLTAGTYAIWVNDDMFVKKGISTAPDKFPKTWDEMRKLSKEFTQWNGSKLQTVGFMPWVGEIPEVTINWWAALNGGAIYDSANHKYTLDSAPVVATLQYWLEWLNDEYKGDFHTVTRSGNWDAYADSKGRATAFIQNREAMVTQGSWYMGDLYANLPAGGNMNWSLASFPVGPGGSKTTTGYWPNWLVIPKGAAHKREAFQYLDYMSTTGMRKYYAQTPDLPANKLFPRSLAPSVVLAKRGHDFGTQASAFFFHQLDVATPMWTSPVETYARDQIGTAIKRVLNKLATPKDAMAQAQRVCQAQLDKTLSKH